MDKRLSTIFILILMDFLRLSFCADRQQTTSMSSATSSTTTRVTTKHSNVPTSTFGLVSSFAISLKNQSEGGGGGSGGSGSGGNGGNASIQGSSMPDVSAIFSTQTVYNDFPTWAIIVITVGGSCFLVLIVIGVLIGIVCCCRNRSRQSARVSLVQPVVVQPVVVQPPPPIVAVVPAPIITAVTVVVPLPSLVVLPPPPPPVIVTRIAYGIVPGYAVTPAVAPSQSISVPVKPQLQNWSEQGTNNGTPLSVIPAYDEIW